MDEKVIKQVQSRKLQFMVNDVFLTTTLQDLMDKLSLQSEQILTIWYTFALDKPKPQVSIPQDEWISCISSLLNLQNTGASSFVVGFFNGDLKIYDSSLKESMVVTNLHDDKIEDAVYVTSEHSNNHFIVSCSLDPFPALKVSEVTKNEVKVVS